MNSSKLRYYLFAVGVSAGIVCLSAILVKYVLRWPLDSTSIFALLALPSFGFYLWSEYARAAHKPHQNPRDAALWLALAVAVLYVFPLFIEALILPTYQLGFRHYQHQALLALLIGLLLIRLHALGSQALLVFTGVLLNIAAVFFLGTRMPELFGPVRFESYGTTFEFFTMVMLGLSYLLMLTIGSRGLVKQALVALGGLPIELWRQVRRLIVVVALSASHLLFGLLLLNFSGQRSLGILMVCLAGLFILMGLESGRIPFFSAAFVEILAAIFAGRVVPAYWSDAWIIWLLLALFILLILAHDRFLRDRYQGATGSLHAWLSVTALCMASEQIVFAGQHARLGVLPVVLLWLAAFVTPVTPFAREPLHFYWVMGGLIYAPVGFCLIWQNPPSIMYLPHALLAAVLISCLIRAYRVYDWQWFTDAPDEHPRLLHHLHWFLAQPSSLIAVFSVATLAALMIQLLSYSGEAGRFADQFFTMLIAQAILMVYWFDVAQKHKRWWATVAAEAMITGVILTLRQGLPGRINLIWTPQWDMLTAVFSAAVVIISKPLLQRQDRAIRLPIRISLFGLPMVTAMYALRANVDFEFFGLVVLPIYAVLFFWQAYSEKDRFILAYAFFGINAYLILLLFHHHIRSPQAYVTPVCLSLLILVEVFRDVTSRMTANLVRTVALLVLLGVALLQAVVTYRLSPLHHAIVLGLSMAAIVIAPVVRVRVFAALGGFAFLGDLMALVYLVLSRQDIETLKVTLGIGLTVTGLLMMAGYYVYRTHKARIDARINQIKTAFFSWE